VSWLAIAGVCAACYLLKLAGMLVPPQTLTRVPWLAEASRRLPAALLAALVVTGTVVTGSRLVVDARLGGLAAALLLLVVRAPLIVVVIAAAAVTGGLRAIG